MVYVYMCGGDGVFVVIYETGDLFYKVWLVCLCFVLVGVYGCVLISFWGLYFGGFCLIWLIILVYNLGVVVLSTYVYICSHVI